MSINEFMQGFDTLNTSLMEIIPEKSSIQEK